MPPGVDAMAPQRSKKGGKVDLESKLDRGIKAMLGKGPANYTPENWRGLREQFRLLILYPGKWVAFRDHYRGEGDQLRLERREVLHATKSLTALQKYLDSSFSRDEQRGIDFVYVGKPTDPLWM